MGALCQDHQFFCSRISLLQGLLLHRKSDWLHKYGRYQLSWGLCNSSMRIAISSPNSWHVRRELLAAMDGQSLTLGDAGAKIYLVWVHTKADISPIHKVTDNGMALVLILPG
jgi:hypothetical protein